MLLLRKILVTHFKNYDFSTFAFNSNVVGICGLNGRGKTNLLDAIYYCCFTKSYFTVSDALISNFNKEGFRLEAYFEKQGQEHKLLCINRGTGRKEISLNDIPYEKFSKHIGLLPAVMIAPDDIELVTGKSENRRKYIDTMLSQLDAGYLQELITYTKVLQQRNSLLKQMEQNGSGSRSVLAILDEQLADPGKKIFEKRKALLAQLVPLVHRFYQLISGNAETVALEYYSQLHDTPFDELLQQNLQKDLLLQRSNAGIHKDDILFELNGQTFRQIASQGQRKSLLFALKMAEFDLLKQHKGFPPLLLLDDVFEKLDSHRMQQLLKLVCRDNDGQVFITDTHRERLEEAFDSLELEFQVIEL